MGTGYFVSKIEGKAANVNDESASTCSFFYGARFSNVHICQRYRRDIYCT
jgi:hypothetical protein